MLNDFNIDLKLAKQLLSFRDFPNDRGNALFMKNGHLITFLLPLRALLKSGNKGKRVSHYIRHTKKNLLLQS